MEFQEAFKYLKHNEGFATRETEGTHYEDAQDYFFETLAELKDLGIDAISHRLEKDVMADDWRVIE